MTDQEAEAIYEILSDPVKFCSVLRIIGKNKKEITLSPTAEQLQIIRLLLTGKHVLILKPRQIGATTIILAFLLWSALVAEDAIVIVLLAHKEKPAKKLLRRIKFMWSKLPKVLKAPLKTNSTTEFIFGHNGAGIYVESGQQDGGVRSDSIHLMHITEINFTPNAQELLTTAKSAVNDNPLILESTANHNGDPLYNEISKYLRGEYKQNQYKYLFFKWTEHEEYQRDPEGYYFTGEEKEFQTASGCSDAQLAWRQDQIAKFGYEKFIREYPMSFEEAYRVTGNTYFNYKDFLHFTVIPVDGTDWTRIDKYKKDDVYAIGVDVGGGVEKNYSVIYVVSKRTMQPVCIWRSNLIDPIALAEYIAVIGTEYGNARVLIESNNHGLATINELRHQGYTNVWLDEKGKNFSTTHKSKNIIFSSLRKYIRNGHIRLIDERTRFELLMVIDENGLIKFGEDNNSHCDNAMAKALAYWCLNSVQLKKEIYLPKWIRERKADKIKQGSGAGIGQHRRY